MVPLDHGGDHGCGPSHREVDARVEVLELGLCSCVVDLAQVGQQEVQVVRMQSLHQPNVGAVRP